MKKILSILLVLTMSISMFAVPVLAVGTDNFELNASDVNVTVDGSMDQTVNVVFSSKTAMTVTAVEGIFTDDSEYLSLTDYVSPVTLTGANGFSVGTGKVVYADDSNFVGYDVTAGGNIMTAVYTVDKDAPTGKYSVTFDMEVVMDGAFAPVDSAQYTATINVTNTSAPVNPPVTEDYTVTIADTTEGTDEVNIGDTVTMNVTVDKPVNGIQAFITYDKSVFSCDADTDANGEIEVRKLVKDTFTEAGSLTFTAIAEGEGEFGFRSAVVGGYDDFLVNAKEATVITDSVKVVAKTYNVVVAGDIQNGTVEANKTKAAVGEEVTLTVTPVEGYKLETLSAGDVEITKVNDTTYTFVMPAADVTVTATFVEVTDEMFDVTINDVDGATVEADKTKAAEGDDVTLTVTPDAGKEIVKVEVKDAVGNTVDVTKNEDGTYTFVMPNGAVEVTVTVQDIAPAFEVEVKADYVTGYTLVAVTGKNETGYTYAGQAMFYVEQYKAYAYLIQGAVTVEAAKAQVAEVAEGTAFITIADNYDVNNTGKVDFYDAGAAFGCYNLAYDVAENMAMYLRADVDGDKMVEADEDVNAIMNNYTK